MMEEVEAAVNPQAVFLDGNIFLRVDGPLAGVGDDAAYVGVDLRHLLCIAKRKRKRVGQEMSKVHSSQDVSRVSLKLVSPASEADFLCPT